MALIRARLQVYPQALYIGALPSGAVWVFLVLLHFCSLQDLLVSRYQEYSRLALPFVIEESEKEPRELPGTQMVGEALWPSPPE